MNNVQARRAHVLGIPVDLIDCAGAVALLAGAPRQGTSLQVVTLNAEMAMQAQSDQELAAAIQGAGLVIPDNKPLFDAMGGEMENTSGG